MLKVASSIVGVVLLNLCSSSSAQGLPQQGAEGARHTYEFSQFTTELRVTGDKEEKSESESYYVVSVEAGKSDTEGNVPYKVTFDQLRHRRVHEGLDVVLFDSQANVATAAGRNTEFFLGALKPLVGASYTVRVDREHHVTSVDGTDEIIKRAESGAVWLKNELTFERLKTRFEHELARFPAATAKQGDVWEGADHVDFFFSGLLMTLKRKYEHLGSELHDGRLLDKVGTTDIAIVDAGRIAWKLEESKGTLYFDRQRGLEVESSHKLQLKATVTFKNPPFGRAAPDQDRTVTVETTRKLRQ